MKTKRFLLLFLALLILAFLFSVAALAEEMPEDDPSFPLDEPPEPSEDPFVSTDDPPAEPEPEPEPVQAGEPEPEDEPPAPAPYGNPLDEESKKLNNIDSGEELDAVRQNEILPENNGVVNTVNGTVKTNRESGQIGQNFGTVERNDGMVSRNQGTVEYNYGSVGYNKSGDDKDKTGIVINNFGSIFWNNGGIVENNLGEIQSNFNVVENNSGTITFNLENGTVENNSGFIEFNGGTVLLNTGTVRGNPEGAIIVNRGGEVYENEGIVYNDGGIVEGSSGDAYNKFPITKYEYDSRTQTFEDHTVVIDASNEENSITAYDGEAWYKGEVLTEANITLAPEAGYAIDSIFNKMTPTSAVDNGDGTWSVTFADAQLHVLAQTNSIGLDVTTHRLSASRPHGSGGNSDNSDDDGVCIIVTDAEMMEYWFNYACREEILNAEENAVVDLDLTAGWDRLQLMTLDALRQRPDVRAWLLLPKGEILALPAGFAARVPECNTVSLATLRSLLKAA